MAQASNGSVLESMLKYLRHAAQDKPLDYYVPSLWLNKGSGLAVKVEAHTFFADAIESILGERKPHVEDYNAALSAIEGKQHGYGGDWTYFSRIYNIFPRLCTAFDHDQDGHIGTGEGDITIAANGLFRESGTFLKTIAILSYIRTLGVNTIYLMPITTIGSDGNKGDMGSPYAIRNPYKLDEHLADPLVPFTVEEQFRALVEAAHIMGFRVLLEFVLRTASKDGDWIKENPEWFYWMKESGVDEYKMPEFPQWELEKILQIPKGNGWHYPPNPHYRSLFARPPHRDQVRFEGGRYVATTEEGTLVIPGAFADWPPDDVQPAWSDVTYLRMYNFDYDADNNYNYIAYNTIRYYDPQLAIQQQINRPLWDKIINVIPHYQEMFGIDGVMIDMGHALPAQLMQEIIAAARQNDPDFAFCEENFNILQSSREAGSNAVLGFEWRVSAAKGGIKQVVESAAKWLPLPFFGTPETHNTPRAMQRGGISHAKLTYVVNSFLPNCMPFIHNGFELCETFPINTGLNFFGYETDYYAKRRLPLFYKGAFNWLVEDNLVEFIRKISALRSQYEPMIAHGDFNTMRLLKPEDAYGHVLAFERYSPFNPNFSILVIANTNYDHDEKFYLEVPGTGNRSIVDQISGHPFTFHFNWVSITLGRGQCIVMLVDKQW